MSPGRSYFANISVQQVHGPRAFAPQKLSACEVKHPKSLLLNTALKFNESFFINNSSIGKEAPGLIITQHIENNYYYFFFAVYPVLGRV